MHSLKSISIFFLLISTGFQIQAQSDSAKKDLFTADLEIRPRTEYRNGFRQLRSDTGQAAFFTSQRSRLNLNFKKEKFAAVLSLQDVRTWGAADPKSTAASVQIFEAFVEPYFNSRLSLRIGKQRIMYDNQRFFAQNDWRQNGGTHDALNLRYYAPRFENELVFAFNQSAESNWFTNFAPTGFTSYKTLGVNYFKWTSLSKKLVVTSINYFEGFQQVTKNVGSEKQNFRYTDGAKVEYGASKWWLALSAYIQHGHNAVGKTVSAFYFQPELRYINKGTILKLGAEIKSGNNTSSADANYNATDHAFQFPYGLAHRYNGTMEYFANGYPGSARDVGLVDPYFFIEQAIKPKLSILIQNHVFFSQWRPSDANKVLQSSTYLGFENDLLLVYRPNSYTKIDLGFSWLLATKSLQAISGGNSDYIPHWSYVQATFTPKLFSIKN